MRLTPAPKTIRRSRRSRIAIESRPERRCIEGWEISSAWNLLRFGHYRGARHPRFASRCSTLSISFQPRRARNLDQSLKTRTIEIRSRVKLNVFVNFATALEQAVRQAQVKDTRQLPSESTVCWAWLPAVNLRSAQGERYKSH